MSKLMGDGNGPPEEYIKEMWDLVDEQGLDFTSYQDVLDAFA